MDILFTIIVSILMTVGFFVICKPRYLDNDDDDEEQTPGPSPKT